MPKDNKSNEILAFVRIYAHAFTHFTRFCRQIHSVPKQGNLQFHGFQWCYHHYQNLDKRDFLDDDNFVAVSETWVTTLTAPI